jgi:D-sedoheptulose 7-phosphate isomerase
MSFENHLAAHQAMLEGLKAGPVVDSIMAAARLLEEAATSGRMILACGNGGSAADADHVVAELVGRFSRTRPALKAVSLTGNAASLTAISNDFGYYHAFARQVEALAEQGGVLMAFSTSGTSASVIRAAEVARGADMQVVALTGRSGGTLGEHADVWIAVPSDDVPFVQDGHRLIYHYICNRIDARVAARNIAAP